MQDSAPNLLEGLNRELEPFELELTEDGLLRMEQASMKRKILGISAILLPMRRHKTFSPDWKGLSAHTERTEVAGLIPAMNMDTGYRNLIDEQTAIAVLDAANETTTQTHDVLAGGKFVAGAFVGDKPGADFDLDAYARQIDLIQERNGVPVIFQSYGLTGEGDVVERYRKLASKCDKFIAFELGQMFVPFGQIYDLETYRRLMEIENCVGAKHSSLDRGQEWQRLALRDKYNPAFKVFTGNDLAIDMPRWGSDYLLGLSTFAPGEFAKRDKAWERGDIAGFYALNDPLQALGELAFRPPVPAYKHSAAQVLKERGWIRSSATHPQSPTRPKSDVPLLRNILSRLEAA